MGTEWYFEDGGKIAGPISYDDLAVRIKSARERAHLIWSPGIGNWTDARELKDFATLFAASPPPLPSASWGASGATATSGFDTLPPPLTFPDPHAWRRYFARMLDMTFFGLFVGLVVLIAGATDLTTPAPHTTLGVSDKLFGWLAVAAYIPFEALLLIGCGTTLGKYLYRIRIAPERRFTFADAFYRSFLVWWRGLGTGIPLVSFFTLGIAHSKLKKNGITSWDRDCACKILHAPISRGRWVLIFGIWIVIAALIGFAAAGG